jgi:WD40 repeat protein
VAFSADGRWLAAGGDRADVRVWDLTTGGRPRSVPDSQHIGDLAFTPDRLLLLGCRRQAVRAVRWPGGELVKVVNAYPSYSWPNVEFTLDGLLVHGTHDTIGCWDPVRGERLWESKPPGRYLGGFACGPGACLALTTDSGQLHRWDRGRGVCTATAELPPDVEGGVLALAFSPDGTSLAVSAEFLVMLWDVADWKEKARWRVPKPCTRMAFTPDGSALVGSTHETLRLWRADCGRELTTYNFGMSSALSLDFAPGGRLAAAGGPEGQVVVWELD